MAVRLQQDYQWGGIEICHGKAYPEMRLLEIVVESICLLSFPRRWTDCTCKTGAD
jgi:hypothetical protein